MFFNKAFNNLAFYVNSAMTRCEEIAYILGTAPGMVSEFQLSDGVSISFNHNLLTEEGDYILWEV